MAKADVDRIVAALPRYPGVQDLLDAFGGKDPLLDAYVRGWLPLAVEQVVEANYPQLICWLLARLLRRGAEAAEVPRAT